MRRSPRSLLRNESGAVAGVVALSLVGLIAAGGIAFDYARLASLDTELQDAADQAALAAATQLDGKADSATRAIAAAQGLLQNQARFGNDSCGINIETGVTNVACAAGGGTSRVRIVFYSTKANAEADTNSFVGTTTNGASAKFVKVEVAERKAKYALTPIVAAFSSGSLGAAATAGLGSAICKIPPLMMCNPQETATNKDFDVGAYKGVGIRLVEGGSSGASWAPGNFGYLQTGLGSGASVLEYALGANTPPGNCLAADGVTTKPGESTSVTDAINTRFDIYENGLTNSCTGGTCSPSNNVRKDVVRPAGSTNFGYQTGNDPWDLPAPEYLPSGTGAYSAPYPLTMGMPRDKCHAVSLDGTCSAGKIGNGVWDRDLYFFVNHLSEYPSAPTAPNGTWNTIPSLVSWAAANGYTTTGLNPTINNITRYDVYKWEIQANSLATHNDKVTVQGGSGKTTQFYNYSTPQAATGLAAGANQPDRRMISMAVVNCDQQGVQGQSKNVTVAKWVDLFIVEPSLDRTRTSKGDIYVEVVRETSSGGSAPTSPQVVKRDVPYLVR